MKSKRQQMREKRQQQKLASRMIWVVIGAAVVGVIGYAIWIAVRPVAGQSVPIMANGSDHVQVGEDPGEYSTDPPTSGPHYPSDLEQGFYSETDLEFYGPYPEGYLVHNLEHGYVIFWYNCASLDQTGCQELKSQIQNVMDDAQNFKVIAFPRPTIDYPVVMTSWGQILEFETFDPRSAAQFVTRNRNQAPEPNAD